MKKELKKRVRKLRRKMELDEYFEDQTPEGVFPFLLILSATAGLCALLMGLAGGGEWGSGQSYRFLALAVIAILGVTGSYWARFFRCLQDERVFLRGEVGVGSVVQINTAWYEEDNEESWPGLIVLCPKLELTEEQAEELEKLGRFLCNNDQNDRRGMTPEVAALTWNVYSYFSTPFALPIPRDLAPGLPQCWMASVTVPPRPMMDEHGSMVVLTTAGKGKHNRTMIFPANFTRPRVNA